MDHSKDYLQDLSDIRNMMEKSSRFISLSGLSGVFAGVFALIGAYTAHSYLQGNIYTYKEFITLTQYSETMNFLLMDAIFVLVLSITTGILLTTRKAIKSGQKLLDATAKRLLVNLFIPLAAGGIFCLALLLRGDIALIAPSTLLFYGIALLNASKYTFNDIRYLGICQILLGLISSFYVGYGLLFWSIGFGVLHILYGSLMYFKYERKA